MTVGEYSVLTGKNVSAGQTAVVGAQIERTRAMLENILGFTLDPDQAVTNLYTELGKAPNECSCSSVAPEDLEAPDAVVGAYRLFSYNPTDTYLLTDPFSAVHKVKLVKDNVTHQTFDPDNYRVHYGRDGWAKSIELIRHDWLCLCRCPGGVQLAVDADWLWDDAMNIPAELKHLWADMVTHYATGKDNIRSETIGPHSYTKFDSKPPEVTQSALLRRYAGPHGATNRSVV